MNTSSTISRTKQRRRILIVDRDLDMRRFLNRTLDIEGFDTVIVADSDTALDVLGRLDPDMVIMDTDEPDENALRAIDNIRQHSNVPIVVLTSDNEVTTLKEAFDHGADEFIRKPFGTRLFIARIKAKLRRYFQEIRP
jgi:DNA-binding response OmpR family regulator